MTLSRVCFLYVTDVLQGTSDIDWLKKMIGCLKQVPGKRKSIDCHKHFLSLSPSLPLFSFYIISMSIKPRHSLLFNSLSKKKTDLIN